MTSKSSENELGLFGMLPHLALVGCVIGLVLITALAKDARGQATFQQTREECDNCCKKSGYDEYYLEQCKLKCFRNHDYCKGSKGTNVEPSSSTQRQESPTEETTPPPERAMGQPPQPQPQPEAQKPRFVWPNPLTLTPGREGEAATHILSLNGIPPQHPNYPRALAAVQTVLMDFARNHPSGGALPTSQLQKIVSQFR